MIYILLSTYNGEKYLEDQLLSLDKQINVDFKIIVRDDGSRDGTHSILNRWEKNHKLKWYKGDNKGVRDSFMELLSIAPPDGYYAFCDQDDYWFPYKLSLTLNKMLITEKNNVNAPIIVHTDMIVVDQNLEIINNSFWHYSKLRPDILNTFNYLCVCNGLNGCTMLLNEKARQLICNTNIKQEIIIHDYLCSLIVAANGGIIEYINEPTMYYRQHSINVVGAKHFSFFKTFVDRVCHLRTTIYKNIAFYKILQKIRKVSLFQFLYRKTVYFIIR